MNRQEQLAQRCNELERRIAALETLEATMAHIFGWDGSVWRKLPLVWGYSDVYREHIEDLNADVTYDSLSGSAVPAGEIWVVNAIMAVDLTSAITRISIYITGGGTTTDLNQVSAPTVNEPTTFSGHAVMKEDEYVGAYFDGTVAGDDIFLNVRGYKMKVSE